jgi:hypothetical protein
MDVPLQPVIAVAIGIGLAAAAGLRVFLPLLIAGLAARFGALPLSDGFQWLSSTGALVTLSTATVVEVAAYSVPGIDHVLDVLAGPAAFAAGALATAAVMVDMPPEVTWPVAIVGGGGVAGLTKLMTALLRAKTGLATAGLANPVVATSETAGALTISLLALLVPLICVAGVVVLLIWGTRQAGKLMRRARAGR